MSDSWQASVVLITSGDRGESHFGTGFVIAKDEWTTYLVTCAHVVRDVGGPDKIKISGIQARVIASSPEDGADLAVLRLATPLDASPLPLLPPYSVAEQDRPFSTAGFQLDGKQFLIRELQGTLGKQVRVQEREQVGRIRAWDLEVTDKFPLQPGYSGSPVVDEYGEVIGVVNTRRGEGKTGVAISIEALEQVWLNRPSDAKIAPLDGEAVLRRVCIGSVPPSWRLFSPSLRPLRDVYYEFGRSGLVILFLAFLGSFLAIGTGLLAGHYGLNPLITFGVGIGVGEVSMIVVIVYSIILLGVYINWRVGWGKHKKCILVLLPEGYVYGLTDPPQVRDILNFKSALAVQAKGDSVHVTLVAKSLVPVQNVHSFPKQYFPLTVVQTIAEAYLDFERRRFM